MIPAFPVYLFDVDGTLLDSAQDICGAIRTVFTARGHACAPDDVLRTYIGWNLREQFLDLGFEAQEAEALIALYRETYRARGHAATAVYPGIADAIARLGGRKATATTKGTPTTRAVLERFGLDHHFDHVQGTDGFPAKPEPDVIHRSLEALGARAEECLLVGDSPADIEAARRAGVRVCAVSWGYGDPAVLAKSQPDFWAHSPHELLPDY